MVFFRVGNTSNFDALSGATPLPLNAYTHVAATYDGTTMRIYINGNLDTSKTTTIGTLANDDLPLRIGQNYFGAVDELEIFNRALAQSEIQAIVAAGSAGKCKPPMPAPTPATSCVVVPAGMTAWYPGDGSTADIQGGNNGTAIGSGVSFAPGKVAQAFQFNGNGQVQAADVPALHATTALTLDAWINPTGVQGFNPIVFKGNGSTSGNQPYSLIYNGANNRIDFRVGNTSTFDALTSFSQAPLNAYTHVAATYDGTRMRLYLNGNLDAVKTTTIGTLASENLPLRIGDGYQGAIDELEIFPVVLPQSEIQRIVAAASFGKCKPGNCPTISVNPSSLPNGMVGSSYSRTINASGGTTPYLFSIFSGSLPSGLTLNASTGEISGTPTQSGVFNFTITATDANSCTGG